MLEAISIKGASAITSKGLRTFFLSNTVNLEWVSSVTTRENGVVPVLYLENCLFVHAGKIVTNQVLLKKKKFERIIYRSPQ